VFHSEGKAKLLLFDASHGYKISTLQEKVNGGLLAADFQLSYNGDYDGDCLTDLILLSQSETSGVFQFLKGDIYNYYTVSSVYTLDEPVHHFSFQDISTTFVMQTSMAKAIYSFCCTAERSRCTIIPIVTPRFARGSTRLSTSRSRKPLQRRSRGFPWAERYIAVRCCCSGTTTTTDMRI
jgi:hypothetical protein